MELIRLDPKDHVEDKRYTSFDSLAWNEKWQEPSDFQMRTYDIEGAREFLQIGTLVTIPDTHTFCTVDNMEYSVDHTGNVILNVTGKSPDNIYKFRPALWRIVASTNPDRKDIEYGDPLELNPKWYKVPSDLVFELVNMIDLKNYQNPELKYLQLPFQYARIPTPARKITEEHIPYYKFDGGDSLSTITELMGFGRFGITPIRPGSEPHYVASQSARTLAESRKWPLEYLNGRPSVMGLYFPDYKADRIVFSHVYDDYIGVSEKVGSDTANIKFRSFEDGVIDTFIGDTRPSGLNAKVSYEEIQIKKSEQWHWDRQISTDMTYPFAKEYQNASSFKLEMDGNHPYRPKHFKLDPFDENSYYLGDVVRIEFPWGTSYDAVVKEFVRTADSGGYKEYPTFDNFVTTDNFVDTKDPISSMAYQTAVKNRVEHKSSIWL